MARKPQSYIEIREVSTYKNGPQWEIYECRAGGALRTFKCATNGVEGADDMVSDLYPGVKVYHTKA